MTTFIAGAASVVVLELAAVGVWAIVYLVRGARAERRRQRQAVDAIAERVRTMAMTPERSCPPTPPVLFPGSKTMN